MSNTEQGISNGEVEIATSARKRPAHNGCSNELLGLSATLRIFGLSAALRVEYRDSHLGVFELLAFLCQAKYIEYLQILPTVAIPATAIDSCIINVNNHRMPIL